MGIKLLWTGLTIFNLGPLFAVPAAEIVGAVFMLIGAILLWLDK